MTLGLLLDSRLAKLQRNANQKLDPRKNYKTSWNRLITISYSWYNIAKAYGNNKLKWRKKTGDWQTLTFPDGMYDCTDINNFLQHIFSLYFNFTIY